MGLLHDLDFEQYPEEHCIRSQQIMRERGVPEDIIHATASHGYAITVDIRPEHEMEKVLYATDELTGLIGAVALMRPPKSTMDLELKSLKKKYKAPKCAAGCSREVIQRGADMLGLSLIHIYAGSQRCCLLITAHISKDKIGAGINRFPPHFFVIITPCLKMSGCSRF